MTLRICTKCHGKRINTQDLSLAIDCPRCNGLGLVEINDPDVITHREYATISRNKERLQGQLTACDNRRKQIMTQCLYHDHGCCKLEVGKDGSNTCLGQCTYRNCYIYAFGTAHAEIRKRD